MRKIDPKHTILSKYHERRYHHSLRRRSRPGHEHRGLLRSQDLPFPRIPCHRSPRRLFRSLQPGPPHGGHRFLQGGRLFQQGRFLSADEPFQADRQGLREQFQPQSLPGQQHQAPGHRRRRRHRLHREPHREIPRGQAVSDPQHPCPQDHRQRPPAAQGRTDVRQATWRSVSARRATTP